MAIKKNAPDLGLEKTLLALADKHDAFVRGSSETGSIIRRCVEEIRQLRRELERASREGASDE